MIALAAVCGCGAVSRNGGVVHVDIGSPDWSCPARLPDRRAGIGPYYRAANLPTLKKGAGFGPTP
jgi:hypothetical protein